MFIKLIDSNDFVSENFYYTSRVKNISDVLDDLLLVVQNIITGIATISKALLTDNSLEYKIKLSANLPEITIHYELHDDQDIEILQCNDVLEHHQLIENFEDDCESKCLNFETATEPFSSSLNNGLEFFSEFHKKNSTHQFESCNSVSSNWSKSLEISENIIRKENPEYIDLYCESLNSEEEHLSEKSKEFSVQKLHDKTSEISCVNPCSNVINSGNISNDLTTEAEFDDISFINLVSRLQNNELNQSCKRLVSKQRYKTNDTHVDISCERSVEITNAKHVQIKKQEVATNPFKDNICASHFQKLSSKQRRKRIYVERHEEHNIKDTTLSSSSSKQKLEKFQGIVGPYKCNYCERLFLHSSSRHRHEKMHTGESPYFCRYCNKSFTQKNNRNKHERIHTSEKSYSSHFCIKSFNQVEIKNTN